MRYCCQLLLLCIGITGCAQAAPPKVKMIGAFPHLTFERPLYITHAGDESGRLFVVEQRGLIHVFPDSVQVTKTGQFLDIRSKVRTAHDEEGLLALAFHPLYRENGHFYVYYSASDPRRGVLSRFNVSRTNPDYVDPASEQVILEVGQPYGNHNGACVLFGPDGYLYISLGDGGSAGDPHNHGQNLGTLLGSILRIDVNREDAGRPYAIPPDIPFVGRSDARPEIWAYGLRNVWRMSFDSETGDLWAADVGQNKWEEINLIVKGGNYGWNIREGAHPYESSNSNTVLIDPVVEYDHTVGASVTGGYVYRGKRFPSMYGVYVYGDYVTGTIWGLKYAGGKVVDNMILLQQTQNISSFGEAPDGELFVTCFDGKIYRLVAN